MAMRADSWDRVEVSRSALTHLLDLVASGRFVRHSERMEVLAALREVLPEPRLEARYLLALSIEDDTQSVCEALEALGLSGLSAEVQVQVFDVARMRLGAAKAASVLTGLDLEDPQVGTQLANKLDQCSRDDLQTIADHLKRSTVVDPFVELVLPRMREVAGVELLRETLKRKESAAGSVRTVGYVTPRVQYDPNAGVDYLPPKDLTPRVPRVPCSLCDKTRTVGFQCSECGYALCRPCLDEAEPEQRELIKEFGSCPECGAW